MQEFCIAFVELLWREGIMFAALKKKREVIACKFLFIAGFFHM